MSIKKWRLKQSSRVFFLYSHCFVLLTKIIKGLPLQNIGGWYASTELILTTEKSGHYSDLIRY